MQLQILKLKTTKVTKSQLETSIRSIVKAEVKKTLAINSKNYKFITTIGDKYDVYADYSGMTKYDYITGALTFGIINIDSEKEFPTVRKLIEKEVKANPQRYFDNQSKKLAAFEYYNGKGSSPYDSIAWGDGVLYSSELGRTLTKPEEKEFY